MQTPILRNHLATILHIAVHLGALFPLLWLFIAIPRGDLGGDPVKELIHYLGLGALRLLLLTLLISPLAERLKFGRLNKLRRPLGLWCYTWASLHFAAWLGLDLAFEWGQIGEELVKRTYILIGFTVWLILSSLAVTSIPKIMRRMGRRWKKLHQWIYLAVLLACIHFWWSLKSGWIEPCGYLAIAVFLLWLRRRKLIGLFRERLSVSS